MAWPPTWRDTIIRIVIAADQGARVRMHAGPLRFTGFALIHSPEETG